MRPDRFLQLAVTAARAIPGVTRAEPVPIEEDGRSKRPFLFAVETGGQTSRWQVTAASAPGDVYSQPEREPVLGDKPVPPETGPATAGSPEHVESALIAAILEADGGEIAGVDAYSRRATPGAIQHGATILFHDGSRVFLNSAR